MSCKVISQYFDSKHYYAVFVMEKICKINILLVYHAHILRSIAPLVLKHTLMDSHTFAHFPTNLSFDTTLNAGSAQGISAKVTK